MVFGFSWRFIMVLAVLGSSKLFVRALGGFKWILMGVGIFGGVVCICVFSVVSAGCLWCL